VFGEDDFEEGEFDEDVVSLMVEFDRDDVSLGALAHAWFDLMCDAVPALRTTGARSRGQGIAKLVHAGTAATTEPYAWAKVASGADGFGTSVNQVMVLVGPSVTGPGLHSVTWQIKTVEDVDGSTRFGRAQGTVVFGNAAPDARASVLDRLVDAARQFGHEANPRFGYVVRRDIPPSGSWLDVALDRDEDESVRDARNHLRGYSWVTLCPEELAVRLGGADRLVGTGVFREVTPLRRGGVLLRVTDTPEECSTDESMEGVFSALAPVLPPGQPHHRHELVYMGPLVYRDAMASG
jgi:hypothetical protein